MGFDIALALDVHGVHTGFFCRLVGDGSGRSAVFEGFKSDKYIDYLGGFPIGSLSYWKPVRHTN